MLTFSKLLEVLVIFVERDSKPLSKENLQLPQILAAQCPTNFYRISRSSSEEVAGISMLAGELDREDDRDLAGLATGPALVVVSVLEGCM